ncbi:MAG: hypothetical protein ACLR23_06245 [Clostridia bacterium]
MIRVGVADYGMNVWDGALYDYELRQMDLKKIGFDGIERLEAQSASDAVHMAARIHAMGMDFATCRGATPETAIQWTAAFGKKYVCGPARKTKVRISTPFAGRSASKLKCASGGILR